MIHHDKDNQGDLFGGERTDSGSLADGSGAYDSSPAPPHPKPLGREGRIRVGTSGYSFADWIGPFYPAGTPRSKMLDEYVRHFDVVEINSSYYRVPSASMFERMELNKDIIEEQEKQQQIVPAAEKDAAAWPLPVSKTA